MGATFRDIGVSIFGSCGLKDGIGGNSVKNRQDSRLGALYGQHKREIALNLAVSCRILSKKLELQGFSAAWINTCYQDGEQCQDGRMTGSGWHRYKVLNQVVV